MTHAEYATLLFSSAGGVPSVEWRVVFHFYAVVHAVNHALYGGVDVSWSHDHRRRELDMDGHRALRSLLIKYRQLRRWSEDARYRPWTHPMPAAIATEAERITRRLLSECGVPISTAGGAGTSSPE